MDKTEARAVLTQQLAPYRERSYAALVNSVGDNEVVVVRGPSGAEYQVEIDIMWDSPRDKVDVLVIGAIDDGHLPGALTPICDSFILKPDATLR